MPVPARAVLIGAILLLAMAVANALGVEAVTPEFQRAEVLAGMAAVTLMLVAVLWTRANPQSAEREELKGEQGLVLKPGFNVLQQEELAWGSHMLLTATPAATVLVFWRHHVILRRGLVSTTPFTPGAISTRSMERGQTISLVNTALFPGRAEFDSVLEGLPAVVVCPLGGDGVVVLGGWSARCFSRSDERWLEGWCQRLRTSLASEGACHSDLA